jgi:hypothetical protein
MVPGVGHDEQIGTRNESSRWQGLAAVPQAEFEAAFAAPQTERARDGQSFSRSPSRWSARVY